MGMSVLIGGAIGPLLMGYVSDRNVASGKPAPRMRLFLLAGPTMMVAVLLVAFAQTPAWCWPGSASKCFVDHRARDHALHRHPGHLPEPVAGPRRCHRQCLRNVFGLGVGPTLVAVAKDSAWIEVPSLVRPMESSACRWSSSPPPWQLLASVRLPVPSPTRRLAHPAAGSPFGCCATIRAARCRSSSSAARSFTRAAGSGTRNTADG